ncbi:MAG: hypothetical protein HQL81_09545 [Magnetococcales bacterium]|nr:hypothetical protein [Magnetococcales bacterium]
MHDVENHKETYFNDQWTCSIHQLGYDDFAIKARDLILSAPTPFAMTIGGRWGAGKTSMLRTLKESLSWEKRKGTEEEGGPLPETIPRLDRQQLKTVQTVWFNPWQYQHEPNPIIPLLHEIRAQVSLPQQLAKGSAEQVRRGFMAGIRTFPALIDDAANIMGANRFSSGKHLLQQIDKETAAEEMEQFKLPTDAQRFFKRFEEAVYLVTNPWGHSGKDNNIRLVVFIDDLDRCSDQTVFSLLERIKLYLSSRYCVFVFALDRTHVENAVARAGGYSRIEAAQYVEKLFQAKLYLPTLDQDLLKRFIVDAMNTIGFNIDIAAHSYLLSLLPPNPRTIKNFMNGLGFMKQFFGKRDPKEAVLLYWLRSYVPDVYDLLAQDPQTIHQDLVAVCKEGLLAGEIGVRWFINYHLENPLLQTEGSVPPEAQKTKLDTHSAQDEHYRQLQAGVWQARALKTFKTEYISTFGMTPPALF